MLTLRTLRRVLYALIVVAVLLAVGIVIVRARNAGRSGTPDTNQPVNVNNASLNSNANTNTDTPANTNTVPDTFPTGPAAQTEAQLKSIARSFAERFGTYSNHANYENISHLTPYMSDRMKTWAEGYLAEKAAHPDYSGIYHGITTRALSSDTQTYDADNGTAVILVKTQRRESTGTSSNGTTTYQDITLQFIRERGVWRVDDAQWQ